MNRAAAPSFDFGPFRLDLAEQTLLRDGQPVPLTPKVFDVLRVLVENAGHLVEKEQLLKEVWPDSFVEEGALNRGVSVLRKTLGENGEQKYIETVPKRGYRFVAPVSVSLPDFSRSIDERAPVRAIASRRVRMAAIVVGAVVLLVAALVPGLRSRHSFRTIAPEHRQITFTGNAGSPSLSPDGTRVAYISDESAEKAVVVENLTGGPPLRVFSAPEVGYLRWSPDGSELIVWARGLAKNGLHIVPQFGGPSRRVVPDRYVSSWSPDGSLIAVPHYLNGRIEIFNTLGEPVRAFTLDGDAWSLWDIDWSRANGLLVLLNGDQRHSSLWTVDSWGAEQTKWLEADAEILAARWAPDGKAIYYLQRANGTMSLNRLDLEWGDRSDASVTTVITGLETDRAFGLSGDGKRLVYARAPFHSNLWAVEPGGQPKALTNGTSVIERPRVSPDGQWVLFSVGREPLANLFTMPLSGGSPRQLTFHDSFNVGGVWSSDGERIAFVSTRGGKARVWTVDARGGLAYPLSSGELSDTFDVTWAPGRQILYQQVSNHNYYTLDAETHHEELLVKKSSPGWMFSPAYSPDGRYVAVMWSRLPDRGIWLIDKAIGRESLLHATPGSSATPIGWSSDGASVYVVEGKPGVIRGSMLFLGETTREAKIVAIPVDRTDVRTVAVLPAQEVGGVSMTPDARRFVYTAYTSRSDVWIVDNFDPSRK